MAMKLLGEIENITTVGDLRQALSEFPDDMGIGDPMEEPLLVSIILDQTDNEIFIEIC